MSHGKFVPPPNHTFSTLSYRARGVFRFETQKIRQEHNLFRVPLDMDTKIQFRTWYFHLEWPNASKMSLLAYPWKIFEEPRAHNRSVSLKSRLYVDRLTKSIYSTLLPVCYELFATMIIKQNSPLHFMYEWNWSGCGHYMALYIYHPLEGYWYDILRIYIYIYIHIIS
jgi:hypothetical protein